MRRKVATITEIEEKFKNQVENQQKSVLNPLLIEDGMKKISNKQIQALLLTTPGPLGAGLTGIEAGKVLGITRGAIVQCLGRFKNKHPLGWNNVMSIRHTASRQRENLEHPLRWERNYTDMHIVEKF